MTHSHHVPEGWPAVIPRIVAADAQGLVGFIQQVFEATGTYQPARPTELRIGDSMLMISESSERDAHAAFLYVYVEDVDGTHRRAMEAGATCAEEPRDLPYGDRRSMVRDGWGNTWHIATHGGAFTP